MKYHQTDKHKHVQNISALKKIEDKSDYSGIEFPASYEDIYKFEDLNKVCVFIFTLATKEEKRN